MNRSAFRDRVVQARAGMGRHYPAAHHIAIAFGGREIVLSFVDGGGYSATSVSNHKRQRFQELAWAAEARREGAYGNAAHWLAMHRSHRIREGFSS